MGKTGQSRNSSKGSTTTGSSSSGETPRRRYETQTFWDEWYRKQGDAAVECLLLAVPMALVPPLLPMGHHATFEPLAEEPWTAMGLLVLISLWTMSAVALPAAGATRCPAAVSATVFTSACMVSGYLAQMIFFKEIPQALTLIGAGCMLVSVVIMAMPSTEPSTETETEEKAAAAPSAASVAATEEAQAPSTEDDETMSLGSFVASEVSFCSSSVRHRWSRRRLTQPEVLAQSIGAAWPEPLKVCELGCGCSHLAPMLRDFGVKVTGVDFSQEVINANRLRHPEIQWECVDALNLARHFEPNYFDAILMQQCHTVLKDHGCVMLLDKACAESIIGRGKARQITVEMHKTMTFRILHVIPRWRPHTQDSAPCQRQWELEIEPSLQKHFVVRPAAAGSGSLQVWSTDNVANMAGVETGDIVLGYRKSGCKTMSVGSATETARAIRTSNKKLTLLMERPAAGASRRKTVSLKTRLMSRQSTSQSDSWRESWQL
eukprot:g21380.t1